MLTDHRLQVMLVDIAARLDELAENELRTLLARQEKADSRLRRIEDTTAGIRDELERVRDDLDRLHNDEARRGALESA
jgi:hypothetical protein